MGKSVSLQDLALTGDRAQITGLAIDSRKVQPGYLFAALPGTRTHGAEFISYALRMGAAAILTDAKGARMASAALQASDVVRIVAQDPRETLARAAALWFGAQPQTMVAVTGTNGKTSVVSFFQQICRRLGHRTISMGTTGIEGDFSHPLSHTTPDALTVHDMLAQAAKTGVSHGAMEASSHGLDQRRMDGVMLSAAGFTNLTQDHFDYHGSFEAYFAAKARLFHELLPPNATAVINIEDRWGAELCHAIRKNDTKLITVGISEECDLRIAGQRFETDGQQLLLQWKGVARKTRLSLIGQFQAHNIALAAGLAIACGENPFEVFDALEHTSGVRGRLELAATRANGSAIYVDYAHTPDAISTMLAAIRPHVMGRLLCVIGAGGDRDENKRPLMGAAAAAGADVVFVTDDNPRSEDPAKIRASVLEGAPDAYEVPDRAEAILRAVDTLASADCLVIAGKGHETHQEIDGVRHPFNDVEQASIAVSALDGILP